jgi:hypothetical protein
MWAIVTLEHWSRFFVRLFFLKIGIKIPRKRNIGSISESLRKKVRAFVRERVLIGEWVFFTALVKVVLQSPLKIQSRD